MANFWDQFRAQSYEDLDKSLGGIPSLLAQKVDPTGYQQRKAQRDAVLQQAAADKLATESAAQAPAVAQQNAEAQSAAGGATAAGTGFAQGLMPIAGQLVKVPHSYLNDLARRAGVAAPVVDPQEAHPVASTIGNVAGTVTGALAQPAVGKMASEAIPALAGRKVMPLLIRNALTAVQGAVPGAIADIQKGTQSAGQAVGDFAKNVGIGTAVGSSLEAILGKLPAVMSRIKKGTQAAAVREGLGIDPRSLRAAASMGGKVKSAGAVRGRAQDIEEGLIDLMNKEGVVDEPSREAWIAAQKLKWQGVDKAFDESGAKVSDFADKIKADPTVASYLQEYGPEGEARLNDLISKADQKAGIGDIREFLQKRIDFMRKNPKDMIDADTADVAKTIRDTIDGAFVPPELKADYGKYKAIDAALTRDDLKLKQPFSVGSQTAGRMIGSGLAGGVLGGATGVDPNDPDYLGKVLGRSAIGFAAGSVAPRIGAAVANRLTGRLAAKIAPLIPKVGEMGSAGSKVGGLVSRLGEEEAARVPNLAPVASAPETQPQTQSEAKSQASIDQAEQISTPEHVAAAKDATNTAWQESVKSKLDAMYDTYLSQYSDIISKDDFFKQADQLTNHFDPRLTAGAIFTDQTEKENYLKSYEAALRLQGIEKEYTGQGKDFLSEALSPGRPRLIGSGALLGTSVAPALINPKNVNERVAYDQLRDWAASLMTEQGKAPAKETINQVSRDLDTIIGMKIPPERKRQLVIDHLANYGLDVRRLTEYGHLGGIV